MEKDKIVFKGSHPDSLYRVPADTISGADRMARILRILRWPAALVTVCVVLAVFVYFLMPEHIQVDNNDGNGTYWNAGATAGAHTHGKHKNYRVHKHRTTKPDVTNVHNPGTQTSEIDFYDAETDKTDFTTAIDSVTEPTSHRVLPIKPVFPSHITPEVQYGNERADADKLRTPKVLEISSTLPDDSTLKPHITQKPEKPLAIYFKDLNDATTTIETISRAETGNEFANYGDKTTKKIEISTKSHSTAYKDHRVPILKATPLNIKQYLITESEIPKTPEIQDYYRALENFQANFTSGHSNLFGLSIEDAERMRSTTQSSLYNTRVSPTLPTWRDGDDTTTKKYPVNVNFEVPQCHSTQLPLCSGILPYDLAGAPVAIAGHDVTSLLPQIEYLVAANCSQRVRHFACALLEPECNPPPYPRKMPCFSLCKAIMDSCEGMIPRQLTPAFNCLQYSRTDCVAAKSPCFDREFTCGDGSCISRDWICDGTKDCPGGEDEAPCNTCAKNEFRCSSGGCILKRWMCDGYSDCANHEDEDNCDRLPESSEPGEESAGSAPAPAVRRPHKLPLTRAKYYPKSGENDSSKELLITSDSGNALKRNFTRRPSPSRLSPYTRTTIKPVTMESITDFESFKTPKTENSDPTERAGEIRDKESVEGDSHARAFFDNLKMKNRKEFTKYVLGQTPKLMTKEEVVRTPTPLSSNTYILDKTINRLEKVINGAALLQKAQEAEEEMDLSDTNTTSVENTEKFDEVSIMKEPQPQQNSASNRPNERARAGMTTPRRAHSPCPTGELRCVDGRCITLAQLCDGTIDCTDHADEDNCYT